MVLFTLCFFLTTKFLKNRMKMKTGNTDRERCREEKKQGEEEA